MTLIDYRVLVSAPPEIVWELLSSLASIPKWHVNCTQASILTTQQEGVGVRCRLNMQAGPDIVLEILSWYGNLGYEYTVVDGPYRVAKGRIRLQAIPEGTTVQWTFEYELGGFAASVRDVSTRRRLTNEVEASLKRLKKLVESTGIRMDDQTRERVSLRPAPTAKERAVLSENIARTQPTMKPVPGQPASSTPPADSLIIDEDDLPPVPEPLVIGDDDLPPAPGALQAILAEAEPPLEDGDTRPNPAVTEEASAPDADAAELTPDEPTLEAEASSAVPAEDDTLPRRPSEAETLPDAFEPVPVDDEHPADDEYPADDTLPAEPVVPEPTPPVMEENVPADIEFAAEESVAAEEPITPPPPADPLVKDIGPSIWEVFGMAPPSAEPSAAAASPAPAEDTLPAEDKPPAEDKLPAAIPIPDAPELDAAQAGPESGILHPRSRQASHPGYRHATRRRARRR